MSELIEPFRDLLRKDVLWSWSIDCDSAFNKLKNILTEMTTLSNYNAKDNFTIQCDASEKALGCCLLQNNRPVYYASRCMSDTEQMYAQVEKEMLSIVFACKKFHKLIYGQSIVEIFTDHQPLISVMKKEINKIPNNRLKRMRLKLMIYNTDVKYCPGKYMYIADLLSRNFIQRVEMTEENLSDVVHTINEVEVKFKNNKIEQFREETNKDNNLSKILKYLDIGWPNKITEYGDIKHYFKIKNELIKENEIIYYENRIIVSKELRKYVIEKLHETHIGITKTLKKRKQIFYWPGMSSDIKNFVEKCEICKKFSVSKTKEPLLQHKIHELPFQKIGIDIAEVERSNYLVVMDYYSRWLEVLSIENKTSEAII
uniref:RNA-directed DNA polymerase n=1 Tax=Schizaphis graminum TaxID=13262 RepID=A0A2S2NXG9_SCHGA